MQTKINQVMIKAPVAVNQAQAKANSDLANNEARMMAYFSVSQVEAEAYKLLKESMKITNDTLLINYFKMIAINSFNPKNRILSFERDIIYSSPELPAHLPQEDKIADPKPVTNLVKQPTVKQE